jgi:hypothetical protein
MLLARVERGLGPARDIVRETSEWREACERFYRKSGYVSSIIRSRIVARGYSEPSETTCICEKVSLTVAGGCLAPRRETKSETELRARFLVLLGKSCRL